MVISSGLDRLSPKGIIIGKIKRKFIDNTGVFLHAEIKPSVELKKLEEVLVITPLPLL
jgi:rod shape-determining protein MreC